MKNTRSLTIILCAIILTFGVIQIAFSQNDSDMETFFSKNYPGLSVRVSATREIAPGNETTVNVWVNCTAEGVTVNYFNLTVYGFINGKDKTLLLTQQVMSNASLSFNQTSQYSYNVLVPTNIWDTTYAELRFKNTIYDSSPSEYSPGFAITHVENTYAESLESQYRELNRTFCDSFSMNLTKENLQSLNSTYWQLQQNYTELQAGMGELDSTRRVMTILGITTLFFVATTAFLFVRKPKQPW